MSKKKARAIKKIAKPANAKPECKAFAKNLGDTMEALGKRQCDIVKETGLTRSAVSALMNGKRDPQLSTIVKILKVIPVKFEKLIEVHGG